MCTGVLKRFERESTTIVHFIFKHTQVGFEDKDCSPSAVTSAVAAITIAVTVAVTVAVATAVAAIGALSDAFTVFAAAVTTVMELEAFPGALPRWRRPARRV